MPTSRSLLACLTATLVMSSGCKKDGCDEKGLDRVLTAVPRVARSDRSELVAQGLLDVCGKEPSVAMPASLTAALTARREWEAGPAAALILKAAKDDPTLWAQACPAGVSGIDVVLRAKSGFESLELARACGAEARGYASEAEFGQAHVADVALSLLAHAWLKQGGTDPVRASRLAKAILEIE